VPAADRAAPLEKVGAGETPTGDSARAETTLPLPVAELADFVRDVERLWRLNPHLDIRNWQPREDGFACAARDELADRDVTVAATVEVGDGRLMLHYADGLRQATGILVEPVADGARLVITDHYPRIDDPQDPRLVEVDRTLVPWVAAIRRHLLARRGWGWLPGWLWWNEHFMLRMAPRSRRIVRLLVWISVLEFAVFLGAVAVLRLAS
jgi:hypothetical protein